MNNLSSSKNESLSDRFRNFFTTRDFIFHDGHKLRRLSVTGRTQAMMAGVAAITLTFSALGVAQTVDGALESNGFAAADAELSQMEAEVARMRADVASVKQTAEAHAARVEQRQALIASVLSGKGDPQELAALAEIPANPAAASVIAPLRRIENQQVAFAIQARAATEQRIAATEKHLRRLGVRPDRVLSKAGLAMGGPFEPLDREAEAEAAAEPNADAQFRSLFQSWKKLDTLEQAVIAIPSLQPVENLTLTSSFGVRSDPFRGTAAMHAGLDIPGPIGTPVYATADGVVSRAQRAGAYGNLVEINHGKGIQTRYGHLSRVIVSGNTRVKRGQLVGLMGSTGRSTGSHLHYEVRIDGRPVNPMPYMQSADMLLASQDKALRQRANVGGPLSK
ncbi:M23 family metallopeptidase [Sphingomonas sp. S1-29]|uniref:M23 family metallopeptidase n=1 Tax=Sphingomonas sp. S1-29 TaxID=2991074 RepID=UPI00223EDE37|nr:M23 family metallopeptidase [Sphingomonas sp. S1-29]UZK70622.1 M23 family metallopeptidase [Sphingomonas sp. S1-29]